ncbi:MAG: CAAD domain-containing protein [Cyanobacteriota bacterium]
MAEPPSFPEPQPEPLPIPTPGPTELEELLAAALDEDDLPDAHPPAPSPTLEAATARPPLAPSPTPPTAAGGEPRVAATLEVPPLPTASGTGGSEGGEWELLVGKVKDWLDQADLPGQWERLGGPLRGLGLLLALLLILKLYVALLDTLDDVPLLPRLLQLLGLVTLARFSVTRLTRSDDRQVVLASWKRRWDAFRGS